MQVSPAAKFLRKSKQPTHSLVGIPQNIRYLFKKNEKIKKVKYNGVYRPDIILDAVKAKYK